MGGGVRKVCGNPRCCSRRCYDIYLQRCRKCGWVPAKGQTRLKPWSQAKRDRQKKRSRIYDI